MALEGGPWIAVLCSAVGGALVWMGWRSPRQAVRLGGLFFIAAAAAWMVARESYPDLWGAGMAPLWLRGAGYLAATGAALAAAAVWRQRGGEGVAFWGLLLGAGGLIAWWVSFEAALAFDARHNGMRAGNETMTLVGVWGLYGLALALAARRFSRIYVRLASRAMLGAGLTLLVLGAFLANGRWALHGYRLFGYVGIMASAWAAEALFARDGDDGDVQGLVSMAAAVSAVLAAAFEMRLWLDRNLFTFAVDANRSAGSVAYEISVRAYAAVAVWGVGALVLLMAGLWLRAPRARLLAAGLSALALGLLVQAAFRPGAPLWLQGTAALAAAGGAVWSARAARGVAGADRYLRWLPWAAGGAILAWVVGMVA